MTPQEDNAVLAQLMDDYAEALGAQTLREYEQAEDGAAVDPALDALCREIIRDSRKVQTSGRRRALKAAGIAAAIVAALFLTLLGVQAAGVDVFGSIASWTGEVFRFGNTEKNELPLIEPPSSQYDPQGHTYLFVHGMYSWAEAQEYAKNEGGYLVRFDSEEEFKYVTAELSSQRQDTIFMIGARRAENSTDYFFVDGEDRPIGSELNASASWISAYWASGEPTCEWEGEPEWIVTVEYDAAAGGWVFNDVVDDLAYPADPNSHGMIIEFEPPSAQYRQTGNEIQTALEAVGIPTALAPLWIPEEYLLLTVERLQNEISDGIVAVYESVDSYLNVEITQYADADALGGLELQMDDAKPEQYVSNGRRFYLFTNMGNWRGAWSGNSCVIAVGGLPEKTLLLRILDSIPAQR